LLLFTITLIATLLTDLLIGVGVGLALKVILDLARGVPLRTLVRGDLQVERAAGELRLVFRHAATFSSLLSVRRAVSGLPEDIERVIIDVRGAKLVDHTFLERVQQMSEEWAHAELQLLGLEQLTPLSSHPTATRRRHEDA
jgi:MFS superfamily sulfate permease-like transporter